MITLIGDESLTLTENDSYTEQGATATDDTDGDISDVIVVGGDVVDTSVIGTYYVTYNAIDMAFNAAVELIRTVVVEALPAVVGDWDGDADVDVADIIGFKKAIRAREKIDASFDLNNDRRINVRDIRIMKTLCTRERCAE